MFHDIPEEILERMDYLEKIDAKDRRDGTPPSKRLRQIPPETGKFIALLASLCPDGDFIEIGTGAGYSTMWLSLAARHRNCKIKTFEILPEKIAIAKETFKLAKIDDRVELYEGDARGYLANIDEIAFCFLDAEKDIYESCYRIVKNKIVKGGMIVADNAISHYETLEPMIQHVMEDDDFDSMIVPIGKGELVSMRI